MAFTIAGVFKLRSGIASGNLVAEHIKVNKYEWPDLVLGKGQHNLLPASRKVRSLLEQALMVLGQQPGWAFQQPDKHGMIDNIESH